MSDKENKDVTQTYYCPECEGPLEYLHGCGSVSYFCNTCKKLISRKEILTFDEMQNKKLEKNKTKDNK